MAPPAFTAAPQRGGGLLRRAWAVCTCLRIGLMMGLLPVALMSLPTQAQAQTQTSAPAPAADAQAALQRFVQDTTSARADFTQTVVPPPRQADRDAPPPPVARPATGQFVFQRPNRFRFVYQQPYEQLIVADGQRVWLYDPDLRQASSRPMDAALGATPAALLAGTDLQRDFELQALPDREGLQWVRAVPRQPDGAFQHVDVGFAGGQLSALEIADSFGQRTVLRFQGLKANVPVQADEFRFTPPPGVDVVEQ